MEPVARTGIVETTTGLSYTTYNVGMLAIAVVLFALSAALVVGGIIGYRKSRATVGRLFATVAIVGGAAILSTLVLGAVEVLPEAVILPILFIELGLAGFLFWVWMLVDCAVKEPSAGNDKLVWVLIILFTHVLGAALYLLVRRPQRLAQAGR